MIALDDLPDHRLLDLLDFLREIRCEPLDNHFVHENDVQLADDLIACGMVDLIERVEDPIGGKAGKGLLVRLRTGRGA